jgi:hypothetical protein
VCFSVLPFVPFFASVYSPSKYNSYCFVFRFIDSWVVGIALTRRGSFQDQYIRHNSMIAPSATIKIVASIHGGIWEFSNWKHRGVCLLNNFKKSKSSHVPVGHIPRSLSVLCRGETPRIAQSGEYHYN